MPPPRPPVHVASGAPSAAPLLPLPAAVSQGCREPGQEAAPLPFLLATLQPDKMRQRSSDRASSQKGSVFILLKRGSEPNACPHGERSLPCGQSHGPVATPPDLLCD